MVSSLYPDVMSFVIAEGSQNITSENRLLYPLVSHPFATPRHVNRAFDDLRNEDVDDGDATVRRRPQIKVGGGATEDRPGELNQV